jgi:hypothetical protein
MNPTFADLLTPAGVVIAAAIVTSLIELIKYSFPVIDARISGAVMAFVGSAVLYILVAFAVGVQTLDQALAVFLAWLSCATSAVGIKSTVSFAKTDRTPLTDAVPKE